MAEKLVALMGLVLTAIGGWIWFWFMVTWAEVLTFVGVGVQLFALYYMED